MVYRILKSPPGYPEPYMVAVYESTEFGSCLGNLRNAAGSRFIATLQEARDLLPESAKRAPFEPEDQFLELWVS